MHTNLEPQFESVKHPFDSRLNALRRAAGSVPAGLLSYPLEPEPTSGSVNART